MINARLFPQARVHDHWAMYAMYHGAYGSTLETPFRDARGTAAHVAASWGAFKFAAENRQGMIHDQIEIFRRGFLDLNQVSIADEHGEQHDFVAEFPRAHVIPVGEGQRSEAEAARLVDFLLQNDIEVQRATQSFSAGGQQFNAGSYVVFMDQPKRGLANTILGPGWDISETVSRLYSSPGAWSQGLLWGADVATVEKDVPFSPKTSPVNQAQKPSGGVDNGSAAAYALTVDSPTAVRATNRLLSQGLSLELATEGVVTSGGNLPPGTVLIPSGSKSTLNQLASELGLRFRAVSELPAERQPLAAPRIAARATELEIWVLRELGFDVTPITGAQINSGAVDLADYDSLLVTQSNFWGQLNTTGRGFVDEFFATGGGLVGTRAPGAQFATQSGVFPVGSVNRAGTGAVRVEYSSDSPIVGAYPQTDTAQVEAPTWFTSLPDGAVVDGRLPEEDFFVAGHWQDRTGAAGQPLIVHGTNAAGTARTVLFGTDTLFRAHPERTFPQVASALYWTARQP